MFTNPKLLLLAAAFLGLALPRALSEGVTWIKGGEGGAVNLPLAAATPRDRKSVV